MENMEYYTQRLQCSDEEKNACLEMVVKLYHLGWYLRKNGILAAEELAEKEEDPFELDGLTQGEPAFDWVFLSHHHNDHCGLLGKLLPEIPVFAGDETKRILNVIADFLCSSANEDRIQAISTAAAWAGRTVCEDLFQSAVRNCAGESIQRFVASGVRRDSRMWPYFDKLYRQKALVGAETLASLPGKKLIFVRTSMLSFLAKYLDARPPEEEQSPLLLYSMWQGYKQTAAVSRLLDFCGERGITVEDLHTSGHAVRGEVKALIDGLCPAALLPIHCEAEDRGEFLSLHENCLMLNDGQCWEVE